MKCTYGLPPHFIYFTTFPRRSLQYRRFTTVGWGSEPPGFFPVYVWIHSPSQSLQDANLLSTLYNFAISPPPPRSKGSREHTTAVHHGEWKCTECCHHWFYLHHCGSSQDSACCLLLEDGMVALLRSLRMRPFGAVYHLALLTSIMSGAPSRFLTLLLSLLSSCVLLSSAPSFSIPLRDTGSRLAMFSAPMSSRWGWKRLG